MKHLSKNVVYTDMFGWNFQDDSDARNGTCDPMGKTEQAAASSTWTVSRNQQE